uniref:Cytochrome c biogenesis protein CcsA n=1 Tax=Cliftonaea pectinata TaxID=2007206 RepID=A0A1Z1MPL3_9FLOR|nr:cytochrome c biogenesis protein ccs1 [Cliftonaea pectinata]ARW68027.1 cytochrome c biogenesis protein ccs1 [Cliftonaea pectinata]
MDWNLVENYIINITFIILLITLIIYWLNLIISHIKQLNTISKYLNILTNISLGTSLTIRWIINKHFPLSNLYESLIFLTWSLTLTQIILEQKTKNKLIGSVSAPISLFTLGFATLCLPDNMKNSLPLVPALRSNWLMMHVTVMMISYASLITGSLLSILFLIISNGQEIEIKGNSYNTKSKAKKFSLKYEFDQFINFTDYTIKKKNRILNKQKNINFLQGIDNLSYRTIGLGFPLLTIGIIAGAVWANEAWGSYWSWDPKETWALITWIIFAIYLHSRLNKSWKGKKPAIIASFGFIIIWVCYLGVNFIGKGLHSYGWLF